jgi:hypothetical protein
VGTGVSSSLLFYCIDESLGATFGQSYTGHMRALNNVNEYEAAFLAQYAVTHGAPSNDVTIKNTIEGPISMAIWQLTGPMAIPQDAAAQPFIAMAQNAWATGQITAQFLSYYQVFVPDNTSIQKFMTGSTPEPGSIILLMSGLIARKREALGGRLTPAVLLEAVTEGALLRLRPKVMTVTTVVQFGPGVMKPFQPRRRCCQPRRNHAVRVH